MLGEEAMDEWKSIARERFLKQISVEQLFNNIVEKSKCAACGKEIVYSNYEKGDRGAWHAHHIDGNPDNNVLSNCACVCINEPENCHLRYAHGGDYVDGPLAPKSAFNLTGQ